MSSTYNKISQATKDGLDGTKHVTRLHDVPGLTRFTDKPVPVSPPKIEAMKFKSSPARVSVDSFKENETASSFSDSLNNVSNRRNDPKGSTDFDVEVDVNSAVRKAIEKAQESIRIAKESVGRKKKGLQSFSNKTFKDSFKVEGTSSQVFPDFKDGKKLLVVKKVIDEINEKISESTKECLIPLQSCNIYKDEHETLCSDEVDRETTKTETLDAAHEDQSYNMFYKGKMKVVSTIIDVQEHQNVEEEQELFERVDVHTLRESKENKDEVVSQGSNQNDSEKLEEVLEQKDVQNVEGDKGDEEVLELFENKNEFEDDHDAKIHDEEGTSEIFCDDFEMTQEDNITDESKGETIDESFDQEFNVKSAGDDKVSEETDNIDGIYVASNIVDMYDNIVETTQDVDDVTEDKESTEGADASEVCEKTSMDQNVSDEDEYEVTSDGNDARCVKTDMDESNKQKNIIDNLAAENGNANEIKDSLESRYIDKEDETEEPGPSNVSGQDHFRRIYEEAAAKERERVRNRSVVERAISEARERAYAEARERAERQRADVKKAIEEARQIKMAEAGEKVAKASVASRSAQSKRRAERATVERATSEACQHALGKAISQKTISDSNSFKSALRTKAKLEKQNRITERAAKMIAEKEKRKRLAQKEKEQAERNHLAENLDGEIKRWSNGKEGNLRALLSTLQYILGPESGWQPVSLTHINTTSDVKKAYRKATLCVHPDKLQQWGASIQHKYICEKVFDLLKAAWKRFNSEER